MLKLDILVLAAHPDDAELSCSGTILSHIAKGYKVGIVDLTEGELGTRGTVDDRYREANHAAKILGLSFRQNLQLPDGFLYNNKEHQLQVIKAIRTYQPEILLANAIHDRHPDHIRASKIAYDACFMAGLKKIETLDHQGLPQQPWRPKVLYNYIQDQYIAPDFIVDISDFWDEKIQSIKAYTSQFFDPTSYEPMTYISSSGFLQALEARSRQMGHAIGVKYGEGFTKNRQIGVENLFDLKTAQ